MNIVIYRPGREPKSSIWFIGEENPNVLLDNRVAYKWINNQLNRKIRSWKKKKSKKLSLKSKGEVNKKSEQHGI